MITFIKQKNFLLEIWLQGESVHTGQYEKMKVSNIAENALNICEI